MKRLFKRRIKEQDLSIQREWYERFYQTVYRIAYRYCGAVDAAQEIVQETFIRAYQYLSTFQGEEEGKFEGWIVTIAKNEALKYVKRQWKRNEIPVEDIYTYKESTNNDRYESIEEHIVEQELIDELWGILETLSVRYRQIILLRMYHDYSYREIGEILGIQENTARQIYHRAKKVMMEQLVQKWGAELETK